MCQNEILYLADGKMVIQFISYVTIQIFLFEIGTSFFLMFLALEWPTTEDLAVTLSFVLLGSPRILSSLLMHVYVLCAVSIIY